MDNIFELASKNKYRYSTNRGNINTEDVWDLPMEALNGLHKSLREELNKIDDSESLITNFDDTQKKTIETLKNKIEIIAYIFKTKREAAEANVRAIETIQRNKRIDELIQKKKDAELEDLSVEQLKRLRNGESLEAIRNENKRSDDKVNTKVDVVEETKE